MSDSSENNIHWPAGFLESLDSCAGYEKEAFAKAHHETAPVSIRLHPDYISKWKGQGALISWCNSGRYLSERPVFTLDPLFHAGAYYVQEASSMFIAEMVRQLSFTAPIKALDLCAAPGGKTTLLSDFLPEKSLILANEVHKTRANILAENCIKWRNPYIIVSNNEPADFGKLNGLFDLILVDAPCSGSGMFRKDPDAMKEWSTERVEGCALRQKNILQEILPALAEDGYLIYSTCSYQKEEDEYILRELVQIHGLSNVTIDISRFPEIIETEMDGAKGYRFWPHHIKGEGFFAAVFQKKKSEETIYYTLKDKDAIVSRKDIAKWDLQHIPLTPIRWQENIYAVPEEYLAEIFLFKKKLYLKKAGICIGTPAGNDLIPSHEYALSNYAASVPSIALNQDQAIQYLRKEAFTLPEDSEIGWNLVTFEGAILGWIKNLKGRFNNYYPKEWRIKSL